MSRLQAIEKRAASSNSNDWFNEQDEALEPLFGVESADNEVRDFFKLLSFNESSLAKKLVDKAFLFPIEQVRLRAMLCV